MLRYIFMLIGSTICLSSHANPCHDYSNKTTQRKKVSWGFNKPTSLPKILDDPLNSEGLTAFDEAHLNVLTGEVQFAKPVPIESVTSSELIFDRAVVETGAGDLPHRIRWVADLSGQINNGRVLQRIDLSANEIRMNARGKVEALRSFQPHPLLIPYDQTMNEVLISSGWYSRLFQARIQFNWNLEAKMFNSGFMPFYGDYRFEYNKRGELSAFSYAATGTASMFNIGSDQSWELLNRVRVMVERRQESVALVIDDPGKYSSLLEMNTVIEKVGEIANQAQKNLNKPLVDARQLTSSWEPTIRETYNLANQKLGKTSEEYREQVVDAMLLAALVDPKIQKEIHQRLELVRANSLPSVTQIVFPSGREDLFIVTETISRKDQYAERVTQFQYRKQTKDFFITGTTFRTQDGKYEKEGEDLRLILKPEYVSGYPGEQKRWVVGSLMDPVSQKLLTPQENEKEFNARLAQIMLSHRFSQESDWSILNLSRAMFHSVDELLIGSALDNMLSGKPLGNLSLLKPYRRLELNPLFTSSVVTINKDLGLQKSRFFLAQDVQDILHQKDTPGAQALSQFIARHPETHEHSDILQQLEKQVTLKRIETMTPETVLRFVPYFRDFSAEEVFSLLSESFKTDIEPLIRHLGGTRDLARKTLKEQLIAQGHGKILEIASQPPEIVVHYLVGSGVIYYVISSKVRDQFGTHFEQDLKGLQRLLGTMDLASTNQKILQLYPGLASYENLSWTELNQLSPIPAGMPNLHSSIRFFREFPKSIRRVK